MRANKLLFGNVGTFYSIELWLTFFTALPSILGCLLRSATASSPGVYQSGVFGRALFLIPPPCQTIFNDIDISSGGSINACDVKVSLFSPTISLHSGKEHLNMEKELH